MSIFKNPKAQLFTPDQLDQNLQGGPGICSFYSSPGDSNGHLRPETTGLWTWDSTGWSFHHGVLASPSFPPLISPDRSQEAGGDSSFG